MDAETIIKIVSVIAGFVTATLIPSIIALVKYIKSYKAAKTEAEKQAAINEMLGIAKDLVASAEETYKNVDAVLKGQGQSGSGAVKKDSVLTKLQATCIEKGIEFDEAYWSKTVDELVELTRQVNAKKGA